MSTSRDIYQCLFSPKPTLRHQLGRRYLLKQGFWNSTVKAVKLAQKLLAGACLGWPVCPNLLPGGFFGECKFNSQRVVERHWTTIRAMCSPNGSPVMEERNLPGSMPIAEIRLGISCRPFFCIVPPPFALSAGQDAQMDPRIYLGSHGIDSATCQPES